MLYPFVFKPIKRRFESAFFGYLLQHATESYIFRHQLNPEFGLYVGKKSIMNCQVSYFCTTFTCNP